MTRASDFFRQEVWNVKTATRTLCGIEFQRLSKWTVCDTLAWHLWVKRGRPKGLRTELRRELMERWMDEVYPGRTGPVKVEVVQAFVERWAP